MRRVELWTSVSTIQCPPFEYMLCVVHVFITTIIFQKYLPYDTEDTQNSHEEIDTWTIKTPGC